MGHDVVEASVAHDRVLGCADSSHDHGRDHGSDHHDSGHGHDRDRLGIDKGTASVCIDMAKETVVDSHCDMENHDGNLESGSVATTHNEKQQNLAYFEKKHEKHKKIYI